jgi:drug/metabolite transporter (DMT)-like permease
MRRRVWLALLGVGIGWGTGGVAVRAALNRGAPPYAVTFFRALFAVVAVAVVLALRRRAPSLDARSGRIGLVLGVVNFGVPFVFWTLALRYAGAGFVGLLSALVPIATAVMAHFLLAGEPLRPDRVTSLLVAMAGVVVLVMLGDTGMAEGGHPVPAALLTIAAVLLTSYAGVYAKGRVGEYDPIEVSGVQFVVGMILIGALMLAAEGVPAGQTAAVWGILVYSGAATTALPAVLYFWMLRHVTATYASVSTYLIPLVALFGGAWLLDERLEAGIGAGGALILLGVVLNDRAERRLAEGKVSRTE